MLGKANREHKYVPAEIRVDHFIPLLLRHRGQQRIAVDSRVVYQVIDGDKLLFDAIEHNATLSLRDRSASIADASPPEARMRSTTSSADSLP
jgi:hypothetical protein